MITGSTYLLRGQPVTATSAWNGRTRDLPASRFPHVITKQHSPRNVQIEHADGRREIRPFRGLLRPDLPSDVPSG